MDETADWTQWPLLQLDAADAATAATLVTRTLTAALDRNTPFAAVIRMPATRPRGHRVAGAVERIRMLKRLRPGLSDRCRGLAFVLPVEAQQANAKVIRSGDKLWGCPTWVTDDVTWARAWAGDQLNANPKAGP